MEESGWGMQRAARAGLEVWRYSETSVVKYMRFVPFLWIKVVKKSHCSWIVITLWFETCSWLRNCLQAQIYYQLSQWKLDQPEQYLHKQFRHVLKSGAVGSHKKWHALLKNLGLWSHSGPGACSDNKMALLLLSQLLPVNKSKRETSDSLSLFLTSWLKLVFLYPDPLKCAYLQFVPNVTDLKPHSWFWE